MNNVITCDYIRYSGPKPAFKIASLTSLSMIGNETLKEKESSSGGLNSNSLPCARILTAKG